MNIFDNKFVNSKPFQYVGKKVSNFINKGGWIFCMALGFFGIIMAIIGHYGQVGFKPVWFFCFDVPFYIFCIWAIYNGIYKPIKNNKEYFFNCCNNNDEKEVKKDLILETLEDYNKNISDEQKEKDLDKIEKECFSEVDATEYIEYITNKKHIK